MGNKKITPKFLRKMHGISKVESYDLYYFSLSKTIKYRDCYGDGSIIFPMWLKTQF